MTAPALPGAAPDPAPGRNDPARLPEDVERAIADYAAAVTGAAAIHFDRFDKYVACLSTTDALTALRAAIRAALDKRGEVSPAAGASAAHVAPPVSASFDAALAALDVENDYAPDRGTTYQIVGLDDVRAAHAEAVRVAVEAERARCMADCDAIYASVIGCADDDGNFRVGIQAGAQRCSAAIRARGVAKPRTDGEAATRSGEGAKS